MSTCRPAPSSIASFAMLTLVTAAAGGCSSSQTAAASPNHQTPTAQTVGQVPGTRVAALGSPQKASLGGFSFVVLGDSRPMMYLPFKENQRDQIHRLLTDVFALVMPDRVHVSKAVSDDALCLDLRCGTQACASPDKGCGSRSALPTGSAV